MTGLGPVTWPPAPLRTERLLLRASGAHDRAAFVELCHVRREAGEAELGYLFLPGAWGHGYATEACAAALDWFAGVLPGEPVVLCTQVANHRAVRLAARLGFTEVRRFAEYGAEQWFGVWSPQPPSGRWTGSRALQRQRAHGDGERERLAGEP